MSQQANFSIVRILGFIAIAVLLAALLITRFGMQSARGGLQPGEHLPIIEAAGWLNGDAPTMDGLKGNVLVVVAYAHWCPPCRKEAPELVKLHKEFSPEGVQFIGLTSVDATELEQTKEFLKEYDIQWQNGYGANNTLQELQVEYIPCVWVVGKDGIITWNMDSEQSQSLQAAIEAALE